MRFLTITIALVSAWILTANRADAQSAQLSIVKHFARSTAVVTYPGHHSSVRSTGLTSNYRRPSPSTTVQPLTMAISVRPTGLGQLPRVTRDDHGYDVAPKTRGYQPKTISSTRDRIQRYARYDGAPIATLDLVSPWR